MAGYIPFTIRAYNGNNLEDTYKNITLSLKTPISNKLLSLPSMLIFSQQVGNALGFSNFLLKKTPIQYVSLKNTITGIETYRQEYVFDDNYDMLTKIYRNGDLGVTINRGNYYDTPIKEYSIPQIELSNISEGVYELEYYFFDDWDSLYYKATGIIAVVENRLPLKKWTVTDVILRTFDLINTRKVTFETNFNNEVIGLASGTKPRFRLKGAIYNEYGEVVAYEPNSTADRLNKVLSPEFAFTKMTLREMLKQVGGFIHVEPRIVEIDYDEDGKRYFVVDFDFYGGTKYSNIKKRRYVSSTLRTDINEYCTALDSSTDNLINRLDWASGVLIEPYGNVIEYNGRKGISLRTESVTVRLTEDDNTVIPSTFPIEEIKGLWYIDNDNNEYDITAFVFEKDNNLSNYEGVFPFTKEYALIYTQGQKNISGLFYKAPALLPITKSYSIKNILVSVGANVAGLDGSTYPELCFKIAYIPRYYARVKTKKQTVTVGTQRTLAYNQSANQVESRFYGEHLKGVIARLGNVEKTYTYNLAFLSDIPKVGTLFDDNYYISSVLTEFLPTYIKCTIALSKDFNRLSQYVGISSNKRMWEVSEKQAFNRDSLFIETVLISQKAELNFSQKNNIFNNERLAMVLFNQDVYGINEFVSAGFIKRFSKRGKEILPRLLMPVMATAIGNTLVFAIQFLDNYSAGQKTQKIATYENNNLVKGYWTNYVPFGDYYGRAYYLSVELLAGKSNVEAVENKALSQDLPQVAEVRGLITTYSSSITDGSQMIVYRKDSREKPNMCFNLAFSTDDSSIIVGSALAKNCRLVNTKPKLYKLYVFSNRINTIKSELDLSDAIHIDRGFSIAEDGNSIYLSNTNIEHKAWAIVTEQTQTEIKVEDDNGETIIQTIYEGGELVLGQNNPLPKENEPNLRLYFHNVGDAYD